MAFKNPPVVKNAAGKERKVGLELEFAGLELKKAAEIIQTLYGGEIDRSHKYEYNIKNTELGKFRVELDARLLRKMAEQDIFKKMGFSVKENSIGKSLEDILDKLAKTVVPLEVVMPPVSIRLLTELEKLRKALYDHKAEGTKVSIVHIFGMHLNIETPDLQVKTILRYMRAFLLVYPWLLEKMNIDISRKISPFVDPFPAKFTAKILDVAYEPSKKQLIDDYLEYNPTRNRPLDLLPIIGMLNKQKVNRILESEKNTPRPAFHYRMPNSRIEDSQWTFTEEWNYWSVIENLAYEDEMLKKLSRLYLARKNKSWGLFKREWSDTVEILLDLENYE